MLALLATAANSMCIVYIQISEKETIVYSNVTNIFHMPIHSTFMDVHLKALLLSLHLSLSLSLSLFLSLSLCVVLAFLPHCVLFSC